MTKQVALKNRRDNNSHQTDAYQTDAHQADAKTELRAQSSVSVTSSRLRVNATVAYLLWFFGGILGAHHLYLHRPRHCFIWFVTWGGMALGWLTEVGQLRHYIDEANQTEEFRKHMKEMRKRSPKPEFNVFLFLSSLMIGHQLANVCVNAVPTYYITETMYGPYLAHIIAAIGASIGVHLSANIGPQEAPFWQPCMAAMCTFPASYFLMHQRAVINIMCILIATVVSSEFATWSRPPQTDGWRTYAKMTAGLAVGLLVYGTLYGSNLYHNMTVNSLNGTRIPLRVAAANFFKTQPWDDAQNAMADFFTCLQMYPLDNCQNQFLGTLTELADPDKYEWSFSVLGFERYPTEKEVANRCRKLSRQWHPDKHRNVDEGQRKSAESRFLDVQRACSVMSKAKMNRERKNIYSDPSADNVIVTGRGSDDDVFDESYSEHKVMGDYDDDIPQSEDSDDFDFLINNNKDDNGELYSDLDLADIDEENINKDTYESAVEPDVCSKDGKSCGETAKNTEN